MGGWRGPHRAEVVVGTDTGADSRRAVEFAVREAMLRDAVRQFIEKEIVPGVLPIFDFNKVVEFSRRCRATVPDWLSARFAGLDGDSETSLLVAAATAAELCRKLRAEGVEAFQDTFACLPIDTAAWHVDPI